MNTMVEHGRSEMPTVTSVQELLGSMPWYRKIFRRGDKRRLAAQILLSRERYTADAGSVAPAFGDSADASALAAERDRLLDAATGCLRAGDVASGWKCLQQLDREMLSGANAVELEVQLVSALSEAERKLGRWRGNAVKGALTRWEQSGEVDVPDPAAGALATRRRLLQEVLFHLHMTHQNLYHNIDKLRVQLWLIGALVAFLVLFVLWLNTCGFFLPLRQEGPLSFTQLIQLAVLSGFAGGTLSVAFQVARADPTQRIPEVTASFIVTLVRPVVGAAVALPVLFFVESGLLAVGDENRRWLLLSLCFVAGFSERWFLGVVEFMGASARGKKEAN